MAYEVFTRKTPRMGNPFVSFSKLGQIFFNQYASRLLQEAKIESILLLWDADERKIALKKNENKKDARAYTIRYNDKGNGASFSAKTFLDHIGVDYTDRTPMPVDITPESEFIVEIAIPSALFAKKPDGAHVPQLAVKSA